ncbi:unnamed protein product [Rhizophagus irregularis]|nr:unnamed protein product [Rhizophagus irregularis]
MNSLEDSVNPQLAALNNRKNIRFKFIISKIWMFNRSNETASGRNSGAESKNRAILISRTPESANLMARVSKLEQGWFLDSESPDMER